jgi:hypothetical protein
MGHPAEYLLQKEFESNLTQEEKTEYELDDKN